MIDKSDAILSLRPGAEWVLRGDDLEWLDQNQSQPSESEIAVELVRLQSIADLKAYQRKRAAEYPAIVDYLDGIVKGDQAQIQAYIDACLAVKARYPKGAK
jgi:SepF-like predicted cell division protein (DUF552 family)